MNDKYKVYIDMDGVIADFDSKVSEITNGQHGTREFNNGQLWGAVYRYNNDVEPFFESLSKMPGADKLVKFVTDNFNNVAVLTAVGSTPKNAAEQKRKWVAINYPGLNVIAVTKSHEKAVYANPRSILVDDRDKSIDPWRKAGGIGILFTSTNQSIDVLKTFL